MVLLNPNAAVSEGCGSFVKCQLFTIITLMFHAEGLLDYLLPKHVLMKYDPRGKVNERKRATYCMITQYLSSRLR